VCVCVACRGVCGGCVSGGGGGGWGGGGGGCGCVCGGGGLCRCVCVCVRFTENLIFLKHLGKLSTDG